MSLLQFHAGEKETKNSRWDRGSTTAAPFNKVCVLQTSAGAESWSLLEMTLLTTQMSGAVFRQVEKASKHVDSEHLKVRQHH